MLIELLLHRAGIETKETVPFFLLGLAVLLEGLQYLDLVLQSRVIPWLMIPVVAILLSRGLYLAEKTLEHVPGFVWWPAPLLSAGGLVLLHALMIFGHAEEGLALLGLVGTLWLYALGVQPGRSLVACIFILTIVEVRRFCGKSAEHWVPYLCILGVATLLLPVQDKPYDWAFVYKAGEAMQDTFRTASMNWNYYAMEFGISGDGLPGYSGISGSARVLGESQVEELYLDKVTGRNNLYLTGSVFGAYNGVTFERTMESEGLDVPYNAWLPQYLSALYQNEVTSEEVRCFSNICSATIRYGYLRTEDLMHPDHLLKMDEAARRDLREPAADFVLDGSRKRGYTYNVTYMEFDETNPYLIRVMENAAEPTEILPYEKMQEYFKELYGVNLDRFLTEVDYAKALSATPRREAWLNVQSTTPRMQELALDLTKDCTSDWERAKVIEDYLHQYTYDVREDFRGIKNQSDAFLFERQKGYCAQYAASMTLLLRLNGIPARYCSGYRTNSSQGKAGLIVHGSQAHAWTEAYLQGYGWVRFEPTGGTYAVEVPSWNLRVQELEGESEEEGDHYIPAPMQLPEPQTSEEELERARRDYQTLSHLALRLFLILALYTVLMLWVVWAIRQHRYRKKTNLDRLRLRVLESKRLIDEMEGSLGSPEKGTMPVSRPLSSYRDSLQEIVEACEEAPFDLTKRTGDLYDLYYRVRFGGEVAVREETWQEIQGLRKDLLRLYVGLPLKGKLRRRVKALVMQLYGL